MFLASDVPSFQELLCIPRKSRAFSNTQALCLPVVFGANLFFPLWGVENALPLRTLEDLFTSRYECFRRLFGQDV
jgi:hypothetical protein